jgi:hypothetical protein
MENNGNSLESMVNLSKLSLTVKLFLTMFIICMGFAYLSAVGTVALTEGFNINSIADHYRGNEAKMMEPPDPAYLMQHTHTHMFGMSLMVFTIGLVFLFARSVPAWLKKFAMVDGFIAVLIATSSFWLIRYVAPWMAVLMVLSGILLGISLAIMLLVPLYEMWLYKEKV